MPRLPSVSVTIRRQRWFSQHKFTALVNALPFPESEFNQFHQLHFSRFSVDDIPPHPAQIPCGDFAAL